MGGSGPNRIVISGCSGGGKSTLLSELARRGHRTVEEPGRRIVARETAAGGRALPWLDLEAFLRRAIEMSIADHEGAASETGFVFFDRGLIDAASALQALTGEPVLRERTDRHRYDPMVFLAPPWPEIYATDPERRHGYDEAVAEYERLARDYPDLGYAVVELPRRPTPERADFVMETLADRGG